MTRAARRVWLLYPVFFCSGAAGLGYQIAWARMFTAGLGHELPATLAVVGAFMGGMAIGAEIFDKFATTLSDHWPGRATSPGPRPATLYAILEVTIGIWALVTTALIPTFNRVALHAIGIDPSPLRHWTDAFLLPLLALLPATAAMGATLPAMARFISPLSAGGQCIGAIYATNTMGAVAGIFASTIVLVPALGLRESVWCFAILNLICGVVVYFIARRPDFAETAVPAGSDRQSARAPVMTAFPSHRACF